MEILLPILLVLLAVAIGGFTLVTRRGSRHSGEAPISSGDVLAERLVENDAPGETIIREEDLPDKIEPVRQRPRLRDRLGKARAGLASPLQSLRGRKVDAATWDELEEALILADVGVDPTQRILAAVREEVERNKTTDPEDVVTALKQHIVSLMAPRDRFLQFEPGAPNVWLFVGVNGVGKTTSIGKVASQQMAGGRSVMLAAGDTFRAAASEQLQTWGERAGVEVVRGAEGGDPGAVIFDAVQRSAARSGDLVLADTAGRLQSKVNLMNELEKISRVAQREPGKLSEVLLVLDATTGQNGLSQAKQFAEAAGLTGIVLTKLDGSAKGGIALAIEQELDIPIKLVGVGEGIEDLIAFDPNEYVDALFAS